MTRVVSRPSLESKVFGDHDRRIRGLEMRPSDEGSAATFLVDDAMVVGNTYAGSLDLAPWASEVAVSSLPQDRTYLEVVWSVAMQEYNVTVDHHHAFVTVQFNDAVGDYFSRVAVYDPDANGQPFGNGYETTSADADVGASSWIIIGFLNDFYNSEPLGFASGRFILPNYAVPYDSVAGTADYPHYDEQTIGKQLFGSATLGGANGDPTTDQMITGAWGGPDGTDPPAITKMLFKVWDYTTIGGVLTQLQFGPGSRFTTLGPLIPDGFPRVVNDGGF